MSELMRQASRLQRKVAIRKEELKTATIDASALLKEEDLGMVQDLIVAAVNAGMVKSNEMVEAEIEKVTGGVNIPGLV
jgi:DNA-binding protein YbaB